MIADDTVRLLLVLNILTISVADKYLVPSISVLHILSFIQFFISKHFPCIFIILQKIVVFIRVSLVNIIIFLTLWHLVFTFWLYYCFDAPTNFLDPPGSYEKKINYYQTENICWYFLFTFTLSDCREVKIGNIKTKKYLLL